MLCRDAVSKRAALAKFSTAARLSSGVPTLDGAVPTVSIANEPADIFYENLGVSIFERFGRRAIIQLLRYLVICVAFVLTSIAVSAKQKRKVSSICTSCGIYDERGRVHLISMELKARFSACAVSGAIPHISGLSLRTC
jgi:hypothetical protein